MTIPEYQKAHNLTYKQVWDGIHNGDIPGRKIKNKWHLGDREPGAPIIRADGEPDRRSTQGGRLKDALTAVQIRKIQQQLAEGQRAIIYEFMDGKDGEPGFREKAIAAFQPLRESFAAAKLTEDQAATINNGIDLSLENLRSISI